MRPEWRISVFLRYSIEDYLKRPGPRFWAKLTLYVVTAAIFIMGVMTLWAFSYQEMGDAVRNLGSGL